MGSGKPKTVLYRRKREQKTRYSKRLKLLLSRKPRLVVRLTNTKIIGQIITFGPRGDSVLVGVDSSALASLGWTYSFKSLPAAYLAGFLLGKTALKKGCQEAVVDTGFRAPVHKGKIYAFIKGVVDAGLRLPVDSKDVFPDEARLRGEHIKAWGTLVKNNPAKPGAQFTQYLKTKSEPDQISVAFAQVKQNIK
ncbi:50S ribosomal protein L18 [Candidatus Woesearchaeota archaeon]|nr:50S ribosomal protein L18 [Candidatus Woesearchaeota archaeon]